MVLLWFAFYASVSLFHPPLLDDADSVHAEVAREMLLRHDYVTLYANGIRYLEKAPLFYWLMSLSMKISMLFGFATPRALAVAARLPLALSILGLALSAEALSRRMFASTRAGLYAALILLSSFGMYLFTRMLIPDAMVCLWITLAIYALWRSESAKPTRRYCYLFALASALNVLTKGLIGIVFPVAIGLFYLLATRGLRGSATRIKQLHPLTSTVLFFAVAAPWHILAGIANPTQGHPAPFLFVHGHWQVPLPTVGNVRGWFWFYFMNEHLLRYLSLRVPHDYDTAPLWLFWGLCLLWLMPFSAFLVKAFANAIPFHRAEWRKSLHGRTLDATQRAYLLLILWATFILLFFALSSRQEYYVLPSLPALAILIAAWLLSSETDSSFDHENSGRRELGIVSRGRAYIRCLYIPISLGALVLVAAAIYLVHAPTPSANTDLATLLTQNPSDYALSLGHFMDLTGPSIALFRRPLIIAACALFFGPLGAIILRRRNRAPEANITLVAGSFGFLVAVLWGLAIFSPVLTSAQLAKAIAPQLHDNDLLCIHGEYESGSTLGFYLQRDNIHILEGRSSNLWYGSFFPDAPEIFESPDSIRQKWSGSQRIFLWQSLTDPPASLPALPGPVYILVKNGGKEIVSNQPNR